MWFISLSYSSFCSSHSDGMKWLLDVCVIHLVDTVEIYCRRALFWSSSGQRQLEFLHITAVKTTHPWCVFLNGSYNDFLEKIFSFCGARQRADWGRNKCPSETSYLMEIITVAVIHYISVIKSLAASVQWDQDSITNLRGPRFQLWIWDGLCIWDFQMLSISQHEALYVIKNKSFLLLEQILAVYSYFIIFKNISVSSGNNAIMPEK